MYNIFHHIENNDDCQFTLQELKDLIKDYAPGGKTIIRKLIAQYESNILITTKSKSLTIICFRDTAANILTQPWYEYKKQNQCDERFRIVKAPASIIKEDISSVTTLMCLLFIILISNSSLKIKKHFFPWIMPT